MHAFHMPITCWDLSKLLPLQLIWEWHTTIASKSGPIWGWHLMTFALCVMWPTLFSILMVETLQPTLDGDAWYANKQHRYWLLMYSAFFHWCYLQLIITANVIGYMKMVAHGWRRLFCCSVHAFTMLYRRSSELSVGYSYHHQGMKSLMMVAVCYRNVGKQVSQLASVYKPSRCLKYLATLAFSRLSKNVMITNNPNPCITNCVMQGLSKMCRSGNGTLIFTTLSSCRPSGAEQCWKGLLGQNPTWFCVWGSRVLWTCQGAGMYRHQWPPAGMYV